MGKWIVVVEFDVASITDWAIITLGTVWISLYPGHNVTVFADWEDWSSWIGWWEWWVDNNCTWSVGDTTLDNGGVLLDNGVSIIMMDFHRHSFYSSRTRTDIDYYADG